MIIDPSLKTQISLYPQEEKALQYVNFQKLVIGIPKENTNQEKRVPLRPEAVQILVQAGHEVLVETDAGAMAQFDDHAYSEAGATIVHSHEDAFKADILLKVEPPTLAEIEAMKQGKTLISALKMATLSPDYLKALLKKKLTAIAYELIEDKIGGIPVMRAMSEIAGSTVMLIAAEYLSSTAGGRGIILGGVTGVPPTRVVVLGAGTVGEYATRTAIGLGANVKVFDQHIYKLRRLKQMIGHDLYTSTFDNNSMIEALTRADVVIAGVRSEKGGRSPMVVTEDMVMQMRPNSIIIDVSIDQGGCVETSEMTTIQNPVFKKHGVIHYCVPNIASRVAQTSSTALSNIFTGYLKNTGLLGGIDEMIFQNTWFMRGVYAYNGSLSNEHIAKKFNMQSNDLNLLRAMRQ